MLTETATAILAPPSQPTLESGRPHAVFRWGAGRFALDVTSVQEVVAELELTPLPRAGQGWLGVGNLRGEILPAVSLNAWFAHACPQPVFLILRTPLGKLALATEGVERMQFIAPEATEPASGSNDAEIAPRRWLQDVGAQAIYCIDAERLAQKLREQFSLSRISDS